MTPAAAENGPPARLAISGSKLPSTVAASLIFASAVLPDYTIRRTVPEVRIQFTVADSRDRLLQSLTRDDVRILDNRLSVSRISSFSRQDDGPLQIDVLLDVSESVEKTRLRERQAAEYLFANIVRPASDRAALLAFGEDLRVWQRFTGDRNALRQALSRIRQQGSSTYLYDGVFRACLEQFLPSRDQDMAQRVLILISDGDDTGSLHSLTDAISMALRREVQVFAISIHSSRGQSRGDSVLQSLTEATGGRFYVANGPKDFQAVFTAMAEQMRTQYSVSFQPVEQTPGFHSVKIQLPAGDKLRIHARQGYFFEAY